MMRVLDLFSGIGGFSLGLERAGMETVAFCEIEPFCRRVLAKHWPGVPIYEDVRELTADRLVSDGVGPIDVICGGFPCQDISTAGMGVGLSGERSGLWREFRRLIEEIRPRFAVIENVSRLRSKGLEDILGGISSIGYDAEWHCVPASAVGARHRQDRVWVLAYTPDEIRRKNPRRMDGCQEACGRETQVGPVWERLWSAGHDGPAQGCENFREPRGWGVEPSVGRVVDGFPGIVDRGAALGNAVVPQIPEMIGRAIMGTQFPERIAS
jgi:DNA (cytosine-5)-methyltransferase 1